MVLNKFSAMPGVLFRENLKVALQAIRANKLRGILTVIIIAFGITALVGILTAIDWIRGSLNEQFTFMGANTFTIESRSMNVQIGNQRQRGKNYSFISYRQAREFKERFSFPAEVSISTRASSTATVKYKDNESNPNVPIIGTDENYLTTAGYKLAEGRNFSLNDIELNRNAVIIGNDLARNIFEDVSPLGKIISVSNGKYKVIGVLEKKGSSMSGTGDQVTLIPYTNVRHYFSRPRMNYELNVKPYSPELLEAATGEAESLFRIIRGLDVKDESDFNITRSDQLARMFIENLELVTIAATIIGVITLFGAAIGLMNIMLVSVTERTREIGVRKALGAKAAIIKQQFLFEAVFIGQIGGIIGIILGMLIGNLMAIFSSTSFIVPWAWMLLGVSVCFVVGILSGYYPALKASRLDPIVSLRYE
jgi:putative ABC transport system permease protein